MFDRHFHTTQRGSEFVTVHEHRAPTDESVRLLKDMEQKARDKVIQSVRVVDSPIDCVIHKHFDHLNQKAEFCAFVRINGKRLEARKSFNGGESQEEIAIGIMDAVAERIAADILTPAFTKMDKYTW